MDAGAIDAQFHRAVDIVQSLPKGGPVQTSYEEKLWLYSLYKQATEGDISAPRPGLLDMLGRAKWDSWDKQKGKDKTGAKQEYVEALLRILRKHSSTPTYSTLIAELEAFDPATSLGIARPASPADSSSSASSSGSSYHSSQASPPDSPGDNPPRHHHSRRSAPSGSSYPLPDPSMPIPDVAPDIIHPSALNASHKSLLSLVAASNHGEGYGDASGSGSVGATLGSAYALPPRNELENGHGNEHGYGHAHGYGSGYGSAGAMGSMGAMGSAYGLASRSASRAHSLVGGPTGSIGAAGGRDSPSTHSRRAHHGAPALGFIPIHPSSPNIPNPNRAFSHPTPEVIQRDYTPDPNITPYLSSLAQAQSHLHPSYPRPGTPSTFSVPPIDVPATLQLIQTSLTALHERMATLERSQGVLLRREERRRGVWGWLAWWSWRWGGAEEDELDEAEDEADRERRGEGEGDSASRGLSGGVGGGRDQGGARRGRWGFRVIWMMIRLIRRLMLDLSIGAVLVLGTIMLVRQWRGRREMLARLRIRARGLIADRQRQG